MDARLLVVLAGVGAAAWMQGPAGDHNAERRRNDFRYTPDPVVVRVVAGAHRSATADLLWLRTLPDLSKEFSDVALKARWIDATLASITDLEPSFGRPYSYGQAYLTNLERLGVKGSADRAIALLEKGIRANPGSAGLRVELAMIHFMEKKDRLKTIEILRDASPLADFDTLSASMLTALMAKQRDDVFGLRYWADLMEEGTGEMRRVAEMHLWRLKAEIAKRAAREFTATAGRPPALPQDLADPKLVQAEAIATVMEGLEIDATGRPRYPALAEMEIADIAHQAEIWARSFRDQAGRWPTLEDYAKSEFGLPAAPAGRAWQVGEGKVRLVDRP